MRNILFRGRMPQTGKWAYGCLLYWAGKAQIWEYDENGATHNYIVDSDTTGQYTGLDDKNGVKIFKGDIIKNAFGLVGDVQWHKKLASFFIQPYGNSLCENDTDEVIGNIHDNPELLEEDVCLK
jgi:uncharacterized phage protein (TIGR01671 family)